MKARRREPHWLNRTILDWIHDEQIREHGGLPGIRDENALESALARPRNKWRYTKTADLPVLAAAYGFGLVRNSPYVDGNKRVGFLAIVTFLGINGLEFNVPDAEVLTVILQLAAGAVTEDELAHWIERFL